MTNQVEEYTYKLTLPKSSENDNRVLMHSCCAPCAGDLMQRMQESGIDQTIFFYNPNIHPKKEYEIRKNENKRFADKLKIIIRIEKFDKI